MDTNDVETVAFNALGGADTITVGDLTGTDVANVRLDLAGDTGSGDGQNDSVIVNGTKASTPIDVSGDATGVTVSGVRAQVMLATSRRKRRRLPLAARSMRSEAPAPLKRMVSVRAWPSSVSLPSPGSHTNV